MECDDVPPTILPFFVDHDIFSFGDFVVAFIFTLRVLQSSGPGLDNVTVGLDLRSDTLMESRVSQLLSRFFTFR